MQIFMAVNNEKHQFDSWDNKSASDIGMDEIVKRLSYCVNKIPKLTAAEHRLTQITRMMDNSNQMLDDHKKHVTTNFQKFSKTFSNHEQKLSEIEIRMKNLIFLNKQVTQLKNHKLEKMEHQQYQEWVKQNLVTNEKIKQI